MGMRLAQYLSLNKLSDAAFGERCVGPIHRTRIWSYRTGRSRPNAQHIAAIEQASLKQVTAQDWTDVAVPTKRRRATRAA
jgi:hypothetical protein